jgi:hypothetical protein
MVAVALAVSICALVLMLGADGAFAATPRLIAADEHGLDYGMLVSVLLIVIALGYFAFDGLAPAYARVRRTRR